MSKSKKLIITGLVILIIGIFGSAVSGVFAIPRIVNDIRQAENESGIVNDETLDGLIENINVNNKSNTDNIDLSIQKSMDDKIHISTINHDNLFKDTAVETHSIDKNSKSLNIDVKVNTPVYQTKSLKDMATSFYNTFLGTFRNYNSKTNKLIIKVPNSVNLKVEGRNIGDIDIDKSDVLKDSLSINTNHTRLIIPKDNALKYVDIKTNVPFDLQLDEFRNAEKINVEAASVFVNEGLERINTKKIPNELNIKTNSLEIEANKPLSKNTNIESEVARIQMPFDKYNVYTKIIGAKSGIVGENFNEEFSGKINNITNFEGKISNGLEGAYNLNINADRVVLENKN